MYVIHGGEVDEVDGLIAELCRHPADDIGLGASIGEQPNHTAEADAAAYAGERSRKRRTGGIIRTHCEDAATVTLVQLPPAQDLRGRRTFDRLNIAMASILSNGVQKGPPIGVEEGPPFQII